MNTSGSGPILSICIPTYNRAAILRTTLEHLQWVKQAPFPVEILVADDASQDESAAVIEEMRRSHLPMIRPFLSRRNRGVERNMTALFRVARGRYLTYLGDDDQLMPEATLAAIQFLDSNPRIVGYYAPPAMWDCSHQARFDKGDRFNPPRLFDRPMALDLFNFMLDHFIMPENAILRTDAVGRSCFTLNRSYFLFDLLFKLLDYGDVYFTPIPFYLWMLRNTPADQMVLRRGNEGVNWILNRRDMLRISWDLALRQALLRTLATHTVPDHLRRSALIQINRYLTTNLSVAANFGVMNRDFVGGLEFFAQSMLWNNDVTPESIQHWQEQHGSPQAAVQAVLELAYDLPGGPGELLFCHAPQAAYFFSHCVEQLWPHYQKLMIMRVVAEQQLPQELARGIVITEQPELRQRLQQQGVAPGRIILFPEWQRNFRVAAEGGQP
ncbi:MAG: glycosyltransferase family 2 protein [Magnetococcales bacterium]|nr:glycosyltransferase family 2 protein [Magnetococcales bacterium]